MRIPARAFATKSKKKVATGSDNVPDCVSQVRENAQAKFDETLEMVLTLKINPRKANELVRGSIWWRV